MPKYSEQDLKYAAEFREDIHKEALEVVKKTHPNITEVIDRHTVEEYFQENWDYPGKWYTVVAIPYGYKNRKALIDQIVRDTLFGKAPERDLTYTQKLCGMQIGIDPDPFCLLIAEYPDLVVDYCIVTDERYCGYESHRNALKTAFSRLGRGWEGDPGQAVGKRIAAAEMFSSQYQHGKLNYRKAFLYPPHKTNCTGKDFVRVNTVLFPNGTDGLEVYDWTTDWSDYFDDGHEWWGTLCLTVYDKTVDRFAVIMASATD